MNKNGKIAQNGSIEGDKSQIEFDYMWMSFVNPNTGKNLGVGIVQAHTIQRATRIAWEQGWNPGGEVMGIPMDKESAKDTGLEFNRLYSADEVKAMGHKSFKRKNPIGTCECVECKSRN